MVLFKSNTDIEIPGFDASAYAVSADHHSSLEKFGRKWYAAGVQAGIAQAGGEGEARTEVRSEEDQDLIASLVARNEELEKRLKEKDRDIENFKSVATYTRLRLISAHAAVASTVKTARGVSDSLHKRLTDIESELAARVIECKARMDEARQEFKKRVREFQEADGGSNKHRKLNGNAFD